MFWQACYVRQEQAPIGTNVWTSIWWFQLLQKNTKYYTAYIALWIIIPSSLELAGKWAREKHDAQKSISCPSLSLKSLKQFAMDWE